MQAEGSGWSAPLALDSGDTARDKVETRPVKFRVRLPGKGLLHEIVARLDLVGGKFARTMVRFCVYLLSRTVTPQLHGLCVRLELG